MMREIDQAQFILGAEQFIASRQYGSTKEAIDDIFESLESKRAYSLVRIGDGEGRLLGLGQTVSREEVDVILRTWFGEKGKLIPDGDLGGLRTSLVQAISGASILGLPKKFSHRKNAKYIASAIFSVPLSKWHSMDRGECKLVPARIHALLEEADFVKHIVRGCSSAYTISCHNVIERLNRKYGNVFSCNLHIPGEQKFIEGGGCHWPVRFNQVMKELNGMVKPGQLWLIGGGVLGKLYCEKVRQLGGVALDIGSVFDLWAGVETRRYIRSVQV